MLFYPKKMYSQGGWGNDFTTLKSLDGDFGEGFKSGQKYYLVMYDSRIKNCRNFTSPFLFQMFILLDGVLSL